MFPEGLSPSLGQSALDPLQDSGTSQGPAATRQTKVARAKRQPVSQHAPPSQSSPGSTAPFPQVPLPEPQMFGAPPPPHVAPPLHSPQERVPPQPSGAVPQFFPCAEQVVGWHPQADGIPPPPHVSGVEHVPQSMFPPHPLVTTPQ